MLNTKKNKSIKGHYGYLLLEVLMAIFILGVIAASVTQVFSRSAKLQQRNAEFREGRKLAEQLMFKVVSGAYPELFGDQGGTMTNGNVESERVAPEPLVYRLASLPIQPPSLRAPDPSAKKYFHVHLDIQKNSRSIYQTDMTLPEPL